MFEPAPWDFDAYSKSCQKQWSVTPRPRWPITQYGGKNITTATNIIFRYVLVVHRSSETSINRSLRKPRPDDR